VSDRFIVADTITDEGGDVLRTTEQVWKRVDASLDCVERGRGGQLGS
jgi:hypothetical protein